MVNKYILQITGLLVMLSIVVSCSQTEDFKEELDNLPQINMGTDYRYNAAYAEGDTMKIVGLLYPEKGLKIKIGNIDAPIVKTEKVRFLGGDTDLRDSIDRVSIIIREEMGVGTDRPVQLDLMGNTVLGTPIEIYTLGGDGSFTKALKLVSQYIFATNRRINTFLNCINGTGNVYYINHTDHQLHKLNKNGTDEVLLTEANIKGSATWQFRTVDPFIGGGVNPQETKAWFTMVTSQGNYLFCEADLQTKNVTVLNTSTTIASPYEGAVGNVRMIVTNAYPNANGDVYLKIGTKNNTSPPEQGSSDQTLAIARYTSSTGQLKYLFRTYRATAPDMPGKALGDNYYQGSDYRFYPQEDALYVIQSYFYDNNSGETTSARGLTLYNLKTRLKLNSFEPGGGQQIIGPFSEVKSIVGVTFGLMPFPGQRILGLAGYDGKLPANSNPNDFPRLLTIGFGYKRVYQYAPSTLDQNNFPLFISSGLQNEMLNYDQEGHIYMTADNRRKIVKTALQ